MTYAYMRLLYAGLAGLFAFARKAGDTSFSIAACSGDCAGKQTRMTGSVGLTLYHRRCDVIV